MNELNQNTELVWSDENAEAIFRKNGVEGFARLLEVERFLDSSNVKMMREHRGKRDASKVERSVFRLSFPGGVFYLKRSIGDSYSNIVSEYNALGVLPRFGLRPSELAAYAFNEKERKALILLKELKGFNSINDMFNGNAPDEAVEDFDKRKECVLARVAEIIKDVHSAGYVYPDWFAKHIFITPGGDEIALIDLERFRPLSECPWYFGFPITSFFVKRKIIRKLKRSLKSDLISNELLDSIF